MCGWVFHYVQTTINWLNILNQFLELFTLDMCFAMNIPTWDGKIYHPFLPHMPYRYTSSHYNYYTMSCMLCMAMQKTLQNCTVINHACKQKFKVAVGIETIFTGFMISMQHVAPHGWLAVHNACLRENPCFANIQKNNSVTHWWCIW